MSIDQETVERNTKNDRAIVTWLLVGIVVITIVAASFAVWRTSVSRAKWFDFTAQMDSQGVEVDAIVVAKQCGARSVKYGWRWNNKDFEGNGWSCNTTCADVKLGTEVRLRFLPSDPKTVECVPDDISRKVGPPSYFDPILLIFFFLAMILIPILRYRK